ncbi:LuxR C-terminal-related transcriptional regulator [Kamptonema formosum]|uniref:LuxR C-terminal-related transcriptional regulator n=1 Tax=Kamptonema formosum TaxID=331992 RepID=UPI00035D5125|nr:LuxR C-terminal-related transcriptional regulator [Oscillatoria sp. PCC 10802]
MDRRQFEAVFERLTYRRKQVLLKLLAGETDATIAAALTVTEATVRKHIENICKEFAIINKWPAKRRCKRPELIALFGKYKPELVSQAAGASSDASGEDSDFAPAIISPPSPQSGEGGWRSEGKMSVWADSTGISPPSPDSDSPSMGGEGKPVPVGEPPFSTLYNRDVFILIDRSGSMVRKDADTGSQTRYEYLEEVVEGHVAAILSGQNSRRQESGQTICDSVSIYFFSRPEVDPSPMAIRDASQVWELFSANQPKTKTFIGPTLEKCLDTWLAEGKPNNRGAFFIIYTDGQFNDEQQFVDCLAKACAHIEHHKTVKFFVLGLGQDVDIEHFLNLDFNINNQLPFDLLVFDLVNEVDDIIELLERQLTDEPQLAFPEWVKRRYPEFVSQVMRVVSDFRS